MSKSLGIGESEAIALGLEIDADFVVLDDYIARWTAKKLGLKIKETLGIIKKLADEKLTKLMILKNFIKTTFNKFQSNEATAWKNP